MGKNFVCYLTYFTNYINNLIHFVFNATTEIRLYDVRVQTYPHTAYQDTNKP